MSVQVRTQAIYDQLLAKLRDAEGFPLSTQELMEGVTVIRRERAIVKPRFDWVDTQLRDCELLAEPTVTGEYVYRVPAAQADVYNRLRQLERRGHVTRIYVESSKRVYWALA